MHPIRVLMVCLAAAPASSLLSGCIEGPSAEADRTPATATAGLSGCMQDLENEHEARQATVECALRSAIREAKQRFSDNRPQAARERLVAALRGSAASPRWRAPGSAALLEARELLHEIEYALGVREGSVIVGVAKIGTDCGCAIKIQEARLEAQNLLDYGKRHYVAREYKQCIELMNRVLEIVRWSPPDVELMALADQAKAYSQALPPLPTSACGSPK